MKNKKQAVQYHKVEFNTEWMLSYFNAYNS